MKKILSILLLTSLLALSGCGGEVDYSDFTTAEEYYEITMEQAADILDVYMAERGIQEKRGTKAYDDAIYRLSEDKEFKKQIESGALTCYIEAYIGANIDSTTKFTKDGIPKAIAGKKVKEYRDKI